MPVCFSIYVMILIYTLKLEHNGLRRRGIIWVGRGSCFFSKFCPTMQIPYIPTLSNNVHIGLKYPVQEVLHNRRCREARLDYSTGSHRKNREHHNRLQKNYIKKKKKGLLYDTTRKSYIRNNIKKEYWPRPRPIITCFHIT